MRTLVGASEFPEDPKSLSDRELVRLSLEQPAQFRHLFDRYWDQVFKFCYFRTENWQLAEDATTQIFENTLKSLQTFDDQGPDFAFRPWLFTITVETVNSMLGKGLTSRDVALIQADKQVTTRPTSEESAMAPETHEKITRMLGLLEPEQRQVIELRLAGLNAQEIAQVVGRSPGEVRTAQHRGVTNLRRLMGLERGGRDESQS